MEQDYIKESLMIEGFLDAMLLIKESNEMEFKSAKGGFPGSFLGTYSSFANTDGDVVIFGVKEKNGIFSVDLLSLKTVNDFKKKFSDLQHNREKVSVPHLQTALWWRLDTETDIYSLSSFQELREQRPVFVCLNPMTGTFRQEGGI